MYGWRGRIGHVSPALHDTQGLESDKLLPQGVMMVTTTLNVQNLVKEEFERAFSIMEQGALALAREVLITFSWSDGPRAPRRFAENAPAAKTTRMINHQAGLDRSTESHAPFPQFRMTILLRRNEFSKGWEFSLSGIKYDPLNGGSFRLLSMFELYLRPESRVKLR